MWTAATVALSEVRTLGNHEKYHRTAGTRDEISTRDILNSKQDCYPPYMIAAKTENPT
jgi:hypothetical protein